MRSASSTWGSVRIRVAIFLWVGQGRGTGRYISIALENAPPCSNRRTWLSGDDRRLSRFEFKMPDANHP
jgi:hypothetical protein